MRTALAWTLAGTFGLGACAVEVTDQTASPLTYRPPINEQTVRVRVDSDQAVERVEVVSPGIAAGPMRAAGGGAYEATLPLPPCAEVAQFAVDVTTDRPILGSAVRRFPDAGLFSHAIVDQPTACEGFAGTVSRTFVVDRIEDFPDTAPGDGVCAGGPRGATGCSVRAAVMEANARRGTDLIRVPPGRYTLTRTGSEAATALNDAVQDLDVTDSVTIEGTSPADVSIVRFLVADLNDPRTALSDDPRRDSTIAKIDGGGIDRVLHVGGAGTVVRVRNLALVNGSSDGPGGGVLNAATLVLERVALADNAVVRPSSTGIGGGAIQNDGLLIADDIALTQNRVGERVFNPSGGALFNTGTATIRGALLAHNDARFGAAVSNVAGGVLRLTNVTLYGHRYGNSTPVATVANQGEADVAFVTLARNRVGAGRLLSNGAAGTFRLRNSLLLDNIVDTGGRLCSGSITTLGGNVTNGACPLTAGIAGGDFVAVSVIGYGGLEDAGGFSPVYRPTIPGAASSLFNPLDRAVFPLFPFYDQRGAPFSRRIDGDGDGTATPDPGAYEHAG